LGMKEVHKTFPWVHSAIGNAKKIMLGFHHSVGILICLNNLELNTKTRRHKVF